MTNIVIVGYGKMGREIAAAAHARNIEIRAIIDPRIDVGGAGTAHAAGTTHAVGADLPANGYKTLAEFIASNPNPDPNTVFIDFTEPNAARANIQFYCENKLNCVVGTTGEWRRGGNMADIQKMVDAAGIRMVHGSNFSTQTHIVMIANRVLCAMLNDLPGYDVDVLEGHHPDKKDPSGTGTTMAESIIRSGYFGKTELLTALNGAVAPNQIMMATRRLSGLVGYHEINYTNDTRTGDKKNDTISLSHTDNNRAGFTNGALDAAEFITRSGATPGLTDYADLVSARFMPLIKKELGL